MCHANMKSSAQKFNSNSVCETEKIAEEFGRGLLAGTVIAYKGGLGAGKTAFTRGLAQGLSLDCEVTSPTFALVHEYRSKDKNGLSLFHFDMYRINSIDDLYSTGFFDYLDENQIIALEWSENIDAVLLDLNQDGKRIITVEIKAIDDEKRQIIIGEM